MASAALMHLTQHPVLRRFLLELHVLLFYEWAQLGSVSVAALDLLLRNVRGNDKLFGGLCVVAAGDHYQNEPIDEP